MEGEPQAESPGVASPGTLLKAARESRGLAQREAADMLNWMPGYVDIVEKDDYASLARPSFARGYVKAFGRLVEVDEKNLMDTFDSLGCPGEKLLDESNKRPSAGTDLALQKTGLGVVVGIGSFSLLVAALWWWQGTI